MAKIRKLDLKSAQNRNRVNFHRRCKVILENENRSSNNANINQDNLNQERDQNDNASSAEYLRRWAVKHNISKRAVSDLLKILISLGLVWLPKDSRTLLSTPRYIEMRNLSNGKLWYRTFSNSICVF